MRRIREEREKEVRRLEAEERRRRQGWGMEMDGEEDEEWKKEKEGGKDRKRGEFEALVERRRVIESLRREAEETEAKEKSRGLRGFFGDRRR